MSDTYLDFLAILAFVECAAAVAVMLFSTIPRAARNYRSTTGAEKTYSWWVLFRTLVCFVCLFLFGLVGLAVVVFADDSVARTQFVRHALVAGITGLAVVGLSGPVETRGIQRALREEQAAAGDERLEELKDKQDADLEISRETRDAVEGVREEQRKVREQLEGKEEDGLDT